MISNEVLSAWNPLDSDLPFDIEPSWISDEPEVQHSMDQVLQCGGPAEDKNLGQSAQIVLTRAEVMTLGPIDLSQPQILLNSNKRPGVRMSSNFNKYSLSAF